MAEAVASTTADAAPRGPSTRLPYRPDLDGLRAVAVVLVVAYHFGIPGFSGGYLGVDLFFVVSGFLIASIFRGWPAITLRELTAFYGRRAKRLLPAFLLVAATTIAVGGVLLLPDDFEALLKSVRESLVARANGHFARATTGYFAATATELPWLHTWSLSIEWQFYLLFPFVALGSRCLPGDRARAVASGLLVLATVALSVALVEADPAQAYFSAAARSFEFLLGAFAASFAAPVGNGRSARWSTGLSVLGVVALVALAGVYTAATPFPGIPALAVCAIGFVLILCGRDGSILADARLAALGKRSYAIYLWHWPVVASLNYVQHRPSGLETAAWLLAILAVSDATWRWIERPGIALPWRPAKTFVVLCLSPFAVVAIATVFVRNHGGFPQRLGDEARHAAANLQRFGTRDLDRCHDDRGPDIEPCAFGDLGASTRALLIGDSHARHFRPFVQVLAMDARVKVYGLTNSECMTLEGTAPVPRLPTQDACDAAVARDYALIRGAGFRYVVLAERWIGYAPEALAGLDASVATIVASGAVPVLMLPVAEDGSNPGDCFYRPIKLREARTVDCSIRRDGDHARQAKNRVAERLRDVQRKFPSLVLVDPQAVQCRADTCDTVLDGTPIYADTHHLNAFGSTMLGRGYLREMGNPFAPAGR